ncbi:MAG: tRNA methyl transferase PRC-barrel domain-containing protein [Chitinophagales bacterium]
MQLTQPNQFKATDGRVIGEHNGAHFYTIGQRKGVKIGGFKEPLFVIQTDTQQNLLFLGEGEQHFALNRPGLFIPTQDVHFIREDIQLKIGEQRTYKARIRYRQPLEECCLYQRENGLYIIFKNLQKGIAAGQFCTWYDGDELIGSGIIA